MKELEYCIRAASNADVGADITEARKELAELEAKAQELNRRERGVNIVAHTNSSPPSCGYCDNELYSYQQYCDKCGTRLIRDSEVE